MVNWRYGYLANWEEASDFFSIYQTLLLSGYVQALTNDLTSAVESFHKALGIRREDTFR
jgi:hypothetical protein